MYRTELVLDFQLSPYFTSRNHFLSPSPKADAQPRLRIPIDGGKRLNRLWGPKEVMSDNMSSGMREWGVTKLRQESTTTSTDFLMVTSSWTIPSLGMKAMSVSICNSHTWCPALWPTIAIQASVRSSQRQILWLTTQVLCAFLVVDDRHEGRMPLHTLWQQQKASGKLKHGA